MHRAGGRSPDLFLHDAGDHVRGKARRDDRGSYQGWRASSGTARVHRCRCVPVRLLHAGPDHVGRRLVARDAQSEEPRLNSSHVAISYAVFCLKKKKTDIVKLKLLKNTTTKKTVV